MYACVYDTDEKQVVIVFDRVAIRIDVEEYLDFLKCFKEVTNLIDEDPDVSLGSYVDDEGQTHQEYIIQDTEDEFS